MEHNVTITIVNYGMGNLGSIVNMLKKIGVAAIVTSEPAAVASAQKLILPGVGSFDGAMENLHATGLVEALEKAVRVEATPILGLCLGMQLFTQNSEEGQRPGLGWIDAQTVRFKFDGRDGLKVPHMGWSVIRARPDDALFRMRDNRTPRFYFAHSYYVVTEHESDILAEADYGHPFVAAVQHENVVGLQFHPEKSHSFGFDVLRNFATAPDVRMPDVAS